MGREREADPDLGFHVTWMPDPHPHTKYKISTKSSTLKLS